MWEFFFSVTTISLYHIMLISWHNSEINHFRRNIDQITIFQLLYYYTLLLNYYIELI